MTEISVITPVYNAARHLAECIDSVLQQTYADFELLLVDDCSVDESAEIIREYTLRDARIRYVRLESNSGAGVARNKGIAMATGRYIAFLDSDDLWHPEKLEVQLEFMRSSNASFSFTSYWKIDDQGRVTDEIVQARSLITYRTALYYNPVGCLTAMYDTQYFGKVYMPALRKRQDYALWLKLLKKAPGHGISRPLAYYRNSKHSISSNKLDLVQYQWKLYREEEKLDVPRSIFYTASSILKKLWDICNAKANTLH